MRYSSLWAPTTRRRPRSRSCWITHYSKETLAYLATRPGRFEYVHTTKHGSWLNLIESACAKRWRVPSVSSKTTTGARPQRYRRNERTTSHLSLEALRPAADMVVRLRITRKNRSPGCHNRSRRRFRKTSAILTDHSFGILASISFNPLKEQNKKRWPSMEWTLLGNI